MRHELKGTGVEVSCVMPGVVNTELTSGLHETRGVKKIEPEDVAAGIVEALEKPRFDVFVPKEIGPINAIMGVLPRRAREGVARLLKADSLLDDFDARERTAYDKRVTGTPAAAQADEPVEASSAVG